MKEGVFKLSAITFLFVFATIHSAMDIGFNTHLLKIGLRMDNFLVLNSFMFGTIMLSIIFESKDSLTLIGFVLLSIIIHYTLLKVQEKYLVQQYVLKTIQY